MRWNVRILPALLVALAAVGAPWARAQNLPDQGKPIPPQPRVKEPTPAPDPKKLEELLKIWEKNSTNLSTLDVMMTRTDRSPAWGDEQYEGRAMLKSPNLAWLDFQKQVEEEDPKTKAKTKTLKAYERIVCTGTEVWQYKAETKQIFVYPLEKDVQQRALEEGPLPFLFNFQAASAQKRYQMTLKAENSDFSLIEITPRLEIDKDSFIKAFVTLDRKIYLLPRRIFLLAPDGKSSKDFVLKLSKSAANPRIEDVNFTGREIPGWKVVRNPGGDAKAPGAGGPRIAEPAPAGAAAPVQQPAMKPRVLGGRRN